jgi:hypothetical protein
VVKVRVELFEKNLLVGETTAKPLLALMAGTYERVSFMHAKPSFNKWYYLIVKT